MVDRKSSLNKFFLLSLRGAEVIKQLYTSDKLNNLLDRDPNVRRSVLRFSETGLFTDTI